MMKCPLCKKGKLEMIGVTDRGMWKMYCPKCYKISLFFDRVDQKPKPKD